MSKKLDHLNLANNTHEAIEHLKVQLGNFPGWVATLAFYKALHVVEAFLLHKHSSGSYDHKSRLQRLERLYPNIFKQFRPLYVASLIARYLEDRNGSGYKTFSDYLTPDQVVSELIEKRLLKLEQLCVAEYDEECKRLLKQTRKIANTTSPR